MVGEQSEAAIHSTTTKGLEPVNRCVYAVYYVCILQRPVGRIKSQRQHLTGVRGTCYTRKITIGVHLFILCVNLLTCFVDCFA